MKKLLTLTLLIGFSLTLFSQSLYKVNLEKPAQAEKYLEQTELKVHYVNDAFIIASGEMESTKNAVKITDQAWQNKHEYFLVWLPENEKDAYLNHLQNNANVVFTDNQMAILESNSMEIKSVNAAVHGGIVKIQQHAVRKVKPVKRFADVPKDADSIITTYVAQVIADSIIADIQHMEDYGSRIYDSPEAIEAQDWIKAQLENYGLEVELTYAGVDGAKNVIAVQPGLVYPDQYIVVGGHFDSTSWSGDAPGADDNASGTAGVMEIARILSQYEFNYSIIYCAWSAEEIGLYGSAAWASNASAQNMDIQGYLNLDMIGYLQEGSEYHTDVMAPSSAQPLVDFYETIVNLYVDDFAVYEGSMTGGDSDHTSFNNNGYMGIFPFEDSDNYSPYIHTDEDLIGPSVNNPVYAQKFVQAGVAFTATAAELFTGFYPPSNLELTQHDNMVELNWTAPQNDQEYLSAYKIFRNGELYATQQNTEQTTFYDYSVANGETYEYTVSALFSGETNGESGTTNTVSVTMGIMQIHQWDFETGVQDWTILDDETGWQWGLSVDLSGNSTNYLGIDSDAAGSSTHVADYAISPVINLEGYSTTSLEFDYGYNDYTGDFFKVVYRLSATDDWVEITELTESNSFIHKIIELPAEALAQNVQIAFYYDDNDTYAWYAGVDNVEIYGAQTQTTYEAPASLEYTLQNDEIALTWAAPETTGVTGYKVYRNGSTLNEITDPSTTSYTDSDNWAAGETYVYYITATYADGESSPSNQVSVYFEPEAIHQIADDAAFVIFPNPVKQGETMQLQTKEPVELLRIFDLSGKLINESANSRGINTFETKNLEAGIYLIHGFSTGSNWVKRLIVTD